MYAWFNNVILAAWALATYDSLWSWSLEIQFDILKYAIVAVSDYKFTKYVFLKLYYSAGL